MPKTAPQKNYIDTKPLLDYDGHIPPFTSNYSQTGFVATASTFFNANFQPFMAFAPQAPIGMNGEWATAGQQAGAWLQIQCPAAVRIWKIRLHGRNANAECITSWNLAGSMGVAFTTLLSSTTTLGSIVTIFNIYRLNVVTAKINNTGLSHFQIFTRKV